MPHLPPLPFPFQQQAADRLVISTASLPGALDTSEATAVLRAFCPRQILNRRVKSRNSAGPSSLKTSLLESDTREMLPVQLNMNSTSPSGSGGLMSLQGTTTAGMQSSTPGTTAGLFTQSSNQSMMMMGGQNGGMMMMGGSMAGQPMGPDLSARIYVSNLPFDSSGEVSRPFLSVRPTSSPADRCQGPSVALDTRST